MLAETRVRQKPIELITRGQPNVTIKCSVSHQNTQSDRFSHSSKGMNTLPNTTTTIQRHTQHKKHKGSRKKTTLQHLTHTTTCQHCHRHFHIHRLCPHKILQRRKKTQIPSETKLRLGKGYLQIYMMMDLTTLRHMTGLGLYSPDTISVSIRILNLHSQNDCHTQLFRC